MTKQEVAEECGYELKKGIVVMANEAITVRDTFYPEDEMKEYWYNETTDTFFENTKEGLDKLCKFEEEKAKRAETQTTEQSS